jgi:hypothetical protein
VPLPGFVAPVAYIEAIRTLFYGHPVAADKGPSKPMVVLLIGTFRWHWQVGMLSNRMFISA